MTQKSQIETDLAKSLRGIIVAVAVFSAFINILMLTVPIFMLQLFDRVLGSGSTDTLIMLSIAALLALLFQMGLDIARSRLLVRLGVRMDKALSGTMLRTLIEDAQRGGKRSTQGIRDLDDVRGFLTGPGFVTLLDAPWLPIYVAVIFLMHPLLGTVALLGAIVLFLIALTSEFASRGPIQKSIAAGGSATLRAETYLRNADIIRSMGLRGAVEQRWEEEAERSVAPISLASDRMGVISAFAKTARMIIQIAMLATGAVLVLKGAATPGVMIAGSILLSRALAPVEQSIGTWKVFVAARGAYARVSEALLQASKAEEAISLPEPEAHLSAEELVFWLPGMPQPLLAGVGLDLKPGEALGIVGPSGAGKSTLARLLVGLDAPTRGAVRLDGAKLGDWRADELGQYIGYLPQDVQLFSGTVSENIAGLDPNPDGKAVVEAAKRAHVHDVILRLPNAYNTDIGPDGALLSAGQRQRVALARALYAQRRVIVLDEPNANLDPAGEEALTKAVLDAKERGCAVIIITHRFNILSIVDKMLVLRNGQTVNYGDAKTIMKEMFGADVRGGQGRFSVIESKEGRKGAAAQGGTQGGTPGGDQGAAPTADQPTIRATGTAGASFGGSLPQNRATGGQGGQQ